MSKGTLCPSGPPHTWPIPRGSREPDVTVAHRTRGLGVVERVPKTAPKGVVFCRLFTDTKTYTVKIGSDFLHGPHVVPNQLI
jgi:hypothetical protein